MDNKKSENSRLSMKKKENNVTKTINE